VTTSPVKNPARILPGFPRIFTIMFQQRTFLRNLAEHGIRIQGRTLESKETDGKSGEVVVSPAN